MNNSVLYILMRNDMASMNPGKAMAQAAHAANSFQTYMMQNEHLAKQYDAWAFGGNRPHSKAFGVTIVLAVNEGSMLYAETEAQLDNIPSSLVHDETYPLLDGETLHLIPLNTCAWVFAANKSDPKVLGIIGSMSLHP